MRDQATQSLPKGLNRYIFIVASIAAIFVLLRSAARNSSGVAPPLTVVAAGTVKSPEPPPTAQIEGHLRLEAESQGATIWDDTVSGARVFCPPASIMGKGCLVLPKAMDFSHTGHAK